MERLILEFLFLIINLFLTILFLRIFKNVVNLRRKFKISLGHNKNIDLQRAIRAHSNFIEYVPFSLVLSMFLYFHNYLIFCCLSSFFLLLGRILHYIGISNNKEVETQFSYRLRGMKFTMWSFYISIIGILTYIVQTLYFFTENYH
tara:strand:+ start:250 stop:687 length:438 start_codon:yes stop_codon:yes gene_type:complete